MHALEFADRPAELLAFLRIGEGQLVGALGEPERHRRRADALAVIGVHQIGEALAPGRAAAATSASAGTAMSSKMISASGMPRSPMVGSRLPIDESLGLVADGDEAADAFLLALLVEDAGEDEVQPRHAAAGDPVLPAVDDEAVAAPVGARGHLAGGAAGARAR